MLKEFIYIVLLIVVLTNLNHYFHNILMTIYIFVGILFFYVIYKKIEEVENLKKEIEDSLKENYKSIEYFGFKDFPTEEEFKERYHEMAQKCHPDHGGSTEQMQELNYHKLEVEKHYKYIKTKDKVEQKEEWKTKEDKYPKLLKKIFNNKR